MANAGLPADARIWLVNFRKDTYYLERSAFSDNFFEHWTLVRFITESSNIDELNDKARQLGVTHLMVRYPFFLIWSTLRWWIPPTHRKASDA
jgi:hypothetical protein